jgi:CheY-like chemotaxis protein
MPKDRFVSLAKPIRQSQVYDSIANLLGAAHAPPSPAIPPPLRSLRVLVAEDNPVNQIVARTLLERLGHDVTIVPDGQAALDALEAGTFEVVLLDIQMPIMDGLEAARRIRSKWTGPERPILVALTAHAMPEDEREAREAGMDDYMTKPITLERLRDLFEKRLRNLLGSDAHEGASA